MKSLHCVAFPDPKIERAGLGVRPELCWWLTPGVTSDAPPTVVAARRQGDTLSVLGHIEPSRRQIVPRFTRNGGDLLVVSGKVFQRLRLEEPGASPQVLQLDDTSANSIDSSDGRVVFFARSLEWPPIWRLDTASGLVNTLEPESLEVGHHSPLLALGPDSRRLAFGHVFDGIQMLNLAAGGIARWPVVRKVPDDDLWKSDMLAQLDFTADGEHLFVVSHPPTSEHRYVLRIGDVAGENVRDLVLADRLPIVAVANGGRLVAAPCRDIRGRVEIFDIASGKTEDTAEVGQRVMALRFDAQTESLTVAHAGGLAVFAVEERNVV